MKQDQSFLQGWFAPLPKVGKRAHAVWVQETFGNINCVHGRVAPFLTDGRAAALSLRFVNAANTRFYRLRLRIVRRSWKEPGSYCRYVDLPIDRRQRRSTARACHFA